jgi:arylformamidase
MTAFHSYPDQAALDAAFTLDTVSDLEGLFARRSEAARAALARFECRRALPYAPGDGRTLNLFPPAVGRAGPAPLLVFIHGGFWRSLDADLFSFVAAGFVPFGAAAAILDYPLMPAVRLAEVVAACRDAVRFLHRNAGELGLDPRRFTIAGNSAGGHLVAELLDSGADLGGPVQGGCAISGLFDLEPVRLSAQNDSLRLTETEVAAFSPLRRDYRPAAPILVTVGGDETGEFLTQSADFAGRIGSAAAHRVEAGMNHITVVLDAFADPAHELNQTVRRRMGLG